MQIKVKGEMTIFEIRQAIFEQLAQIEEDLAIRYSRGATLYINPTNGFGDDIEPMDRSGRRIDRLYSDGGYRSAAMEYKL
ncbi:MAG: hypothetical protein AB2801_09675 [Candidatus Thiodiazotropha endolucinida]